MPIGGCGYGSIFSLSEARSGETCFASSRRDHDDAPIRERQFETNQSSKSPFAYT